MSTLVFCCGAECGVAAANTTPPSGVTRHWATVTGATVDTTTVRSPGSRSYKIAPVAAAAGLAHTISGSPTVVVSRVYFQWSSLPGANARVLVSQTGSGVYAGVYFKQSALAFMLGTDDGVTITQVGTETVPVVANVWYMVELRLNVAPNNAWLADWAIDSVARTQQTIVRVTDLIADVEVGCLNIASTQTAFIDDIACSVTSADYPLGPGTVVGLAPNADGTHSFTLNDFLYNAAGGSIATTATDVNTYLDDTIDNTTDFINQAVIRTAGYVEVLFADLPSGASRINGVEVVYGYHSATTTANTAHLQLNDNGTISSVSGLIDWSETSLVSPSKQFATAPSTGVAWTEALVNGLRARFGYSTDATPDAYLDAVRLEVDFVRRVRPPVWLPVQAVQRAATR